MTPRSSRTAGRYELEGTAWPQVCADAHRVVNISVGGACLEATHDVPVGQHVDLTIQFADLDRPLQVRGEIVWSRLDQAREGVRFVGLDVRQAEWLRDYLESHPFHRIHSRAVPAVPEPSTKPGGWGGARNPGKGPASA